MAFALTAQVERTAAAARKEGMFVEIDHRLPTVLVYLGEGNEFFFQEHEASELLDRVPDECNEEDYILWEAQGW